MFYMVAKKGMESKLLFNYIFLIKVCVLLCNKDMQQMETDTCKL